jgi:hypothetical protein
MRTRAQAEPSAAPFLSLAVVIDQAGSSQCQK